MIPKSATHPGKFLKEDCLDPLGMTIAQIATPKVTEEYLGDLIDGNASITPEAAELFEQKGWSVNDFWIGLQLGYDTEPEPRKVH